MARQRRTFSTEFKQEAASLVLDQGYSMMEASRSLDVGETALRCWVQPPQNGSVVCLSHMALSWRSSAECGPEARAADL